MPDILLYGLLIIFALRICMPIVFFVLKIVLFILLELFYVVQGRFKEFNDRMQNDSKFLTFDKETGKFIW